MRKFVFILLIPFIFSGCFAGLLDAVRSNGYMDGIPNYRNDDVADVAKKAAGLGVDPSTIVLTDLLTEEQREKYKAAAAKNSDDPPANQPVINIIIDEDLIQTIKENSKDN